MADEFGKKKTAAQNASKTLENKRFRVWQKTRPANKNMVSQKS